MKVYTFYKAVSGYWFIEHSLKGTTKLRRWPVSGSIEDAIKRFEIKGYKFFNKYGYDKNAIANS